VRLRLQRGPLGSRAVSERIASNSDACEPSETPDVGRCIEEVRSQRGHPVELVRKALRVTLEIREPLGVLFQLLKTREALVHGAH